MDGLACLELLQKRHPGVKTVVLTGLDSPDVVRSAFRRGATAFISKRIDPRDLASALRQAVAGTVLHPVFGDAPEPDPTESVGLSDRELEILSALSDGLSNKQIAKKFWLAEQTVKFHLTNVYRKLGVSTRTEAVHQAYRQGLLDSPLLEATTA